MHRGQRTSPATLQLEVLQGGPPPMTSSTGPLRLHRSQRALPSAISAALAALICSGLVSTARAEDRVAPPPTDPATLSAIAEDVLRRASASAAPAAPELHSPIAGPLGETSAGSAAAAPVPPIAHMPPG